MVQRDEKLLERKEKKKKSKEGSRRCKKVFRKWIVGNQHRIKDYKYNLPVV